jgi:hypothetical protein
MNTRSFGFLLLFVMLFGSLGYAQVISESAKRKVTVGVDVFTDIWQNKPDDMYIRTINQGANVFAMYNFQLANGPSTFGVGLGISNHNLYSHSRIDNIKADTIVFTPIPDDLAYRRTKINLTYLDIPFELKLRFKNEMKLGVGFKIGYLITSKEKYIGDTPEQATRVTIKTKNISELQSYAYGFTLRFGYKSVNLFGYYQISQIFNNDRGPELYPISVGITLTPF